MKNKINIIIIWILFSFLIIISLYIFLNQKPKPNNDIKNLYLNPQNHEQEMIPTQKDE